VGNGNTACGSQALRDNSSDFNTAVGLAALSSNTTGFRNTATGGTALTSNTTGSSNTANGSVALFSNTTGSQNTANGTLALFANTTGFNNTATGLNALFRNTTGDRNTATGRTTLQFNTTGRQNVATGNAALFLNTTGNDNTADGTSALLSNTTGSSNIALGLFAGGDLTTGSNNIDIGNPGVADESNTIRIGTQGTHTAAYIAGVSGAGVVGSAVKVNAAGQIGTAPSSSRYKQDIKPMDNASKAIHTLKPVTFRYKKELDPEGVAQFGLVAEDVEKVNPDLVMRDAEGKIFSVRYDAVNAMLLNEFLKEHQTVQELKKQVAELTEGLQKVSAKLEASKPAPQVVNNP
jgi:hypothetical protein